MNLHESILFLAAAGVLGFVSGCAQPEPITDYDAVQFDKWGRVLVSPHPEPRPTRGWTHADSDDGGSFSVPDRGVSGDDASPPDGGGSGSDHGPSDADTGNPGNHKSVGKAGETPGPGDWGAGDKGKSR